MLSFLTSRLFRSPETTSVEDALAAVAAISEGVKTVHDHSDPNEESTLFRTLGWVTAGFGAIALGLFVGRELRQRYKFNRRTPYDFYAHSGDEHDLEFGVGV